MKHQHPTIQGYDAHEVGDAVRNMWISHGLSMAKFSTATGMSEDELKALMQGKSPIP